MNEKVEAFWKGIDGGVDKRGQIIVTFSEKKPRKSWFQVYTGEVNPIHRRVTTVLKSTNRKKFHGSNGMPITVTFAYLNQLHRIINAEIRQPKSDQGKPS